MPIMNLFYISISFNPIKTHFCGKSMAIESDHFNFS